MTDDADFAVVIEYLRDTRQECSQYRDGRLVLRPSRSLARKAAKAVAETKMSAAELKRARKAALRSKGL